jgi:uncharacterized membrane protein YpjA
MSQNAFGLARRLTEKVNADRRLLLIVLLINVAGTLFGLYYYWDQLAMTPWYLWLVVPDCPLYTLFMAIALTLILIGKPWTTFNAITAVGTTMYGTWTVIVLLYFGEVFFSQGNVEPTMQRLISHGAMAFEGFLLLPYLTKVKPVHWALTALWFIALDSVDYFYHFTYNGLLMRTHPLAVMEYYWQGISGTATQAKIDSLVYITFGLTAIFFVIIAVLSRVYGKTSDEKKAVEKEIRT